MIKSLEISDIIVSHILNLPEVLKSKEQLNLQSEGSVNFNIHLNTSLKEILHENFELDLSTMDSIPMRWMKGDTKPNIDRSNHIFDKTHLAYLTDSQGELIIQGESYPISKGKAYIFSEGLQHETMNPNHILAKIYSQNLRPEQKIC